jgi:hypothetical protein
VRVFPVLKPGHWQGVVFGARAHVWIGTETEPELIVAYGCYDHGLVSSYVTNEMSGHGHPDALVKEAFDNLEAHHTDFELVEMGGDRVLIAAGPMAAERVLCQSHMLRAHDKLGVDEMMVSIARRDSFMACAADASDQLRRTIAALHAESWLKPGPPSDRIFNQLVVFNHGNKVGTVNLVGPEPGQA